MADNSYTVEIKICSKNGWSTPQEVLGIWGVPYARTGMTMHWWGDGSGAGNHDNIVNYFLGQANAGNKSVNYVLSDNKITLMVSPDNVAWCSSKGNPTTISIEHQPTLGAEGYKKSGWLVDQLEQRYGRGLKIFPHNYWAQTACPGSLDLNRIRAEADKWKRGDYDYKAPAPVVSTPKPIVVPTPPPAVTVIITHSPLPASVKYTLNKDANMWNYNAGSWSGFKVVKAFKNNDPYTVFAIADNHNVKAKYGVTEYSYKRGFTHGLNMMDLKLVAPDQPTIPIPPPVQVEAPAPVKPTAPVLPTKDEEQDRRLSAIESFIESFKKLFTRS